MSFPVCDPEAGWLVYRHVAGHVIGRWYTYEMAVRAARQYARDTGKTYCVRRAN